MELRMTLRVFLVAAFMTGGARASAQELAGEDLLLMNLKVVSASKYSERMNDAPANMVVITRREIHERGYQDLKDVLRDLPGIDLTPNIGGEAGGWLVLMRGIYGNNKLQVLVDGDKLNPASGDRFVWGNNIPLANVERIEVLYGPASALYGADAFAGIINVITGSADGGGSEARLAYGNAGTRDASYLFSKKFDNGVGLRLFGRRFDSDGFDLKKEFPNIYGRLDTRDQGAFTDPSLREFEAPVRDYNLHAKLDYRDFSLALSRAHYHESNTLGEQVKNYVMNKDAFWAFDKDIVALKHTLELSDGASLNSNLIYDRYAVDPESDYLFWWGHAHKYAEAKRTSLEEQLNVRMNDKVNCTFGAEAAETANLPYTFDLAAPLDNAAQMWVQNPTYGYVVGGTTIPFSGRGEVSVRTFGAYGQVKYSPTGELNLTAGGRYDYNSHYGHEVFNPRAGAVYQPDDRTVIKVLYGRAFISPSMWSSYLFWMAPTYGHVDPESLGLGKLKPEKLQSAEASLSYKITPELLGTAVVYQHRSKDIITNAPYGVVNILDTMTSGATRQIETSRNLGEQKVTGVDLLADYRPAPKWRVNAGYSYIGGTLDDTLGKKIDLPKVSRHKGTVGVSGEFWDHFGVYVREKWVGAIRTMPSNNYTGSDYGGDNALGGYLMTDVYLRVFGFVKGLECSVKVDNLFNTRAYGVNVDNENDVYGNVSPRLPLDPRRILVGLTYKF